MVYTAHDYWRLSALNKNVEKYYDFLIAYVEIKSFEYMPSNKNTIGNGLKSSDNSVSNTYRFFSNEENPDNIYDEVTNRRTYKSKSLSEIKAILMSWQNEFKDNRSDNIPLLFKFDGLWKVRCIYDVSKDTGFYDDMMASFVKNNFKKDEDVNGAKTVQFFIPKEIEVVGYEYLIDIFCSMLVGYKPVPSNVLKVMQHFSDIYKLPLFTEDVFVKYMDDIFYSRKLKLLPIASELLEVLPIPLIKKYAVTIITSLMSNTDDYISTLYNRCKNEKPSDSPFNENVLLMLLYRDDFKSEYITYFDSALIKKYFVTIITRLMSNTDDYISKLYNIFKNEKPSDSPFNENVLLMLLYRNDFKFKYITYFDNALIDKYHYQFYKLFHVNLDEFIEVFKLYSEFTRDYYFNNIFNFDDVPKINDKNLGKKLFDFVKYVSNRALKLKKDEIIRSMNILRESTNSGINDKVFNELSLVLMAALNG